MWYRCCLLFNIHSLRAGRPRPYLDKKLCVFQVDGGGKIVVFHARHLIFQNHTNSGSGFWIFYQVSLTIDNFPLNYYEQ
jgi:hypothetical protein